MKYLIDTHTHTIASGHAYNTIDEMTRKAAQIGLPAIAFTEHTPKMPGSCGKLYFSNFKVLPREKFGVRRLFGCEANIMDYDGTLDMPDTLLEKWTSLLQAFIFHVSAPVQRSRIRRHWCRFLKIRWLTS